MGLTRLQKYGPVEPSDLIKDFPCLLVQIFSPPRGLKVEMLEPGISSKVHKDGVQGNDVVNVTSGAEWGEARARGGSFVQEPIIRGVEGSGVSGDGVFDCHREVSSRKEVRMGNDELVFPSDVLCGA